ncbi:MAG: hypothetical protein V4644_00410 [Patescibacteria group bacterium]
MSSFLFELIQGLFIAGIFCAIAFFGGTTLANLMGRSHAPERRWLILPTGLIWIGIAGLVLFWMSDDMILTNGLTGLAVLGFLTRCFMEWVMASVPRGFPDKRLQAEQPAPYPIRVTRI